jgi:hypothetical protein
VTKQPATRPTIDEVLQDFFAEQRRIRPSRTDRSFRLEAHLRHFLEVSGPAYLSEESWMMLQVEECFEPRNAFVRLMPVDHLLPPLHEFLSPEWLMTHGTDRLVQVNHTYRLVCWLCSSGLVDLRELRPSIIRFLLRHDELTKRPEQHKEQGLPLPQVETVITREDLP